MRIPLILLFFLLPTLASAASAQFYVSPTGSDHARGTAADPFRTLDRARNALRALRHRAGLPAGGVTVWLRAGDYPLSAGLALSAEDSGTPAAPVVWRAAPGETVRLLGGLRVTQWSPVTAPAILARLPEPARAVVRVADLTALGVTDSGRLISRGFGRPPSPAPLELFSAGVPQTLARWPATGWTTIAGVPHVGKDEHGGQLGDLKDGFFYTGDRPAAWKNTGDLWVHGYWAWDWADSQERVTSLDPATRLVKTASPYGVYGFRPGQRFFFLNVLEEISLGQYYVDRDAGKLYFWPPEDAGRATRDASGEGTWVSVLAAPLVSLTGCANLTLQGLTLEYARGTGVTMDGCTACRLADCTLRNLGDWGARITGGAACGLSGCDLYQLGDGGVSAEGGDRKTLTPGGHFVENCDIHDLDRWSRTYHPGVLLQGVGQRVVHCHIHAAPHTGILINGNDHLIEYNELDHLCGETGDVGAFYIGRDYTERGNVVRYNYFHDIHAGGSGGSNAVYLDDCASGVTVVGNVFYHVEQAVFIGGGRDHIVENNVFVDCHPSVAVDGRGLDQSPVWHGMVTDTMKKRLDAMNWLQPPYSTRYPHLADLQKYYGSGLAQSSGIPPEGNVIRHNISTAGPWLKLTWYARPGMMTIADNLTDQDPKFVNQSQGDFHLQPDSPAWALGFQKLPLEEMGLTRRKP